jgi:hypothetical protein
VPSIYLLCRGLGSNSERRGRYGVCGAESFKLCSRGGHDDHALLKGVVQRSTSEAEFEARSGCVITHLAHCYLFIEQAFFVGGVGLGKVKARVCSSAFRAQRVLSGVLAEEEPGGCCVLRSAMPQ